MAKKCVKHTVKEFSRTLKNKIEKHVTSVSRSAYIDKLVDIVNEYNNAYHKTIRMKPMWY